MMEIHADEAYYWVYSRFLDWGYYDHPPMVALFIKAGYTLFHNPFGVRLVTLISSTVSIYVLWLILKSYEVSPKWFVLAIPGIFIFNIYGFTTTPDSPLFLFTVLFYFVYKRYLEEDVFKWALLLAVIIACLLYSKYHGILLLLFTIASNIRLLTRRSFWMIVFLAVVFYLPHVFWQVHHGYPSFYYHLFERSSAYYNWSQTMGYIPGQLLMAGPLFGWFLFYSAFKTRINSPFIRCLVINCIGTYIFFFFNTLKGEVQPHWTLIAFVPLVMLALIRLSKQPVAKSWIIRLAIINICLIVFVRISMMFGAPYIKRIGQLKSYYGYEAWANKVKQKVGDNYVILTSGFQNPSKYNFNNNTLKAFSYDSRYYRRTQYDIWPIEDSIQHKRAFFLLDYPVQGLTADSIPTEVGTWYGTWVDDVRTYQKINIQVPDYNIRVKAGDKKEFDLLIKNPYSFPISFSNIGYSHPVALEGCVFDGSTLIYSQPAEEAFHQIMLKPGESTHLKFTLNVPERKGRFDLFFSFRTEPFPGGKNNRVINLTIE